MSRRFLVCPDSFKGSLSAAEAAEAMKRGILEAIPDAEVIALPVGDGGEGTISALMGNPQFAKDAVTVVCDTVDPLRRPIKASYEIWRGETAFIESAAASGLTLLSRKERDVFKADSYGTGLLIVDAFDRGIRRFVLGMGGTATCDAGYGAWEAIRHLPHREMDVTLLCDVRNPLCGVTGAAHIFGPQKGAPFFLLPYLDERLRLRAREYADLYGRDVSSLPFAGAAGGLAGMLMASCDATPVMGIDFVLDVLDLRSQLEGVELAITGEGCADITSLGGKAPMGVLNVAREVGVPVALVCGKLANREFLDQEGFAAIMAASPYGIPSDPAQALSEAVCRLISGSGGKAP